MRTSRLVSPGFDGTKVVFLLVRLNSSFFGVQKLFTEIRLLCI